MPKTDIDVPSEWTEFPDERDREAALIEYQYETTDKTTFVVSLLSRSSDSETYKLRLSIIDPTSNHVRHDYPVEEYETRERAVTEAESFIEFFTQRIQEGAVSSATPDIEAVRGTIRDFSEDRLFPSVRGFIRRLR